MSSIIFYATLRSNSAQSTRKNNLIKRWGSAEFICNGVAMNFLFVFFRFVRHQFRALLLLLGLCLPASALAGECVEAVAKAISIQGGVESRSHPNDKWEKVSVQDHFCFGDQVRTLANSRAALHLNNNSILRLNEHSTISFSHSPQQGASRLNLKTGIVHFITRLKQRFEVVTPYVNAAVDGTEFVVAVEAGQADSGGQTRVTVLEGQVRTHNAQGEINLSQGETALARAGQPPTLQARIKPWNAVSWALYYPAVIDFTTLSNAQLKQSLEHYHQGEISAALTTLDALPDDSFNSNIYVYRAALYLAVGQVVHARTDLERALRLESRNGKALALKTLIAVVQNQTERALESARHATELSPDAAATWLAQSYAQQAVFDLEPARRSVEQAVKLAPESALAWARLAELHLMFGDLDRTLQAAQRAIDLAPELARTQSVLGFAYLTRMKTKEAKRAFEKAISLDQTAPLPHLGLGLAIIREGDLEQGRIEIETATSLDPRHSIIRSYLGKAYYEEKRNDLAVEQFVLAKQLDPKDPTPWYYGAISKQIENNPVEALNDLHVSSNLNNNRAVYRSSFLLDSDEAARSASQARIYSDLGFDRLALIEGWKSVNTNPASHSGHRLLADAYASLPRHEIARVSELLQAQLLQPINTTPIQPQLAESNLGILDGSGPSALAFNEFNPLFVRNGIRFQTNLLGGSHRTLGNDLVLSGIQDKFSFSLGQFNYRTDGFRENNDQTHDIFDIFAQVAITPKLNIQAEYRDKETDQGDLELNFDPADFSTQDRRTIKQQTRRIGINFSPTTQSTILLSFFNSKKDGKQQRFNPDGPEIDEQNNEDGNQFESQYIFKNELFNLVGGIGQYDINSNINTLFDWTAIFGVTCPTSPPFPPSLPLPSCGDRSDFTIKHETAYVYTNFQVFKNLMVDMGLSLDRLKDRSLDVKKYNPKLGIQWDMTNTISFRAAYIKSMNRTLLVKQTIEPTFIAGFNQLFDEDNGTISERIGLGMDFSKNHIHSGIEITQRKAEIPQFEGDTISFADRDEDAARAYFLWSPNSAWSFNIETMLEKIDNKALGPQKLDSITVPVNVTYFNSSGFIANLRTTYLKQDITLTPDSTFVTNKDNFTLVDFAIGYRLPKRMGIINMEIKNLFDKEFFYQDLNFINSAPVSSAYIPDRIFFIKANINI